MNTRLNTWSRELGLGARFAFSGREGWFRTLLTAFGVGCAVALLMLATALPGMMNARNTRGAERDLMYYGPPLAAGADTLLVRDADTEFHGAAVHGELVRPEGPHVATPPGLSAWPGPGTMYVSPALRELLAAPGGALLKQRLPYREVGTVGDAGLVEPGELAYYAGDATLSPTSDNSGAGAVYRTNSIGGHAITDGLSPMLTLLTVVTFLVLLIPVGVFVATAVRIGGERRDRRLAALRLVGVDIRGTHRVAAGEALVGAVLGLPAGLLVFAVARELVARVQLLGLSVFPSDLTPRGWLVGLIALAVPLCALVVTTVSLRGVVIEPLGVVRAARPPRRRLWWRLLLPALGVLLLLTTTLGDTFSDSAQRRLIAGVASLLVGVTLLLPWLMERVVGRLGRGPVPLQLGSRRLQLSGGAAARTVSGVVVAVAGAIAVQSLFGGVSSQYTTSTGRDLTRAQAGIEATLTGPDVAERVITGLRSTPGVLGATGLLSMYVTVPGSPEPLTVAVGDCATLVEYAAIGGCRPGGVYDVPPGASGVSDGQGPLPGASVHPGQRLDLNADDTSTDGRSARPSPWTIPTTLRTVAARRAPDGSTHTGVFATPQALAPGRLAHPQLSSVVRLAPGDGDAIERARTAVSAVVPGLQLEAYSTTTTDRKFANIRRGLLVGAVVTLLLIALGMAVSTTEQLRERKRLLAVLVAFGTKRSTLALSVLWQSAVPILLGLPLALAGGIGLGALLLRVTGQPVGVDWGAAGVLLAAGAGAVAAATLLSLPALWRMMRADGLRTE
ncbi:ABC transporter permease [Streptacidiphilus pinicola]|uniref:ABC transporter permease n=1 Tax=Streptacidiphilus pinicola TaxID=2219663 RepID=A0A2X0IAY2_9ACTN|nr:FtsX-like permease family protein [Streptacidiphilus pinicola]RAG82122.1 ABC transporter permease [Streptacidiphilus pinicola]